MKKTTNQAIKKLSLNKHQITALTEHQINNVLGGDSRPAGVTQTYGSSCTLLASSDSSRNVSRVCA